MKEPAQIFLCYTRQDGIPMSAFYEKLAHAGSGQVRWRRAALSPRPGDLGKATGAGASGYENRARESRVFTKAIALILAILTQPIGKRPRFWIFAMRSFFVDSHFRQIGIFILSGKSLSLLIFIAHRNSKELVRENLVMATEKHLKILSKGLDAWNKWRTENSYITSDLDEISLKNLKLQHIDLSYTSLIDTDLSGADLSHARLDAASLWGTKLIGSILSHAYLAMAYFLRFVHFWFWPEYHWP